MMTIVAMAKISLPLPRMQTKQGCFPVIKERLKFKKLIAMNAEPGDDTSSSSVR